MMLRTLSIDVAARLLKTTVHCAKSPRKLTLRIPVESVGIPACPRAPGTRRRRTGRGGAWAAV